MNALAFTSILVDITSAAMAVMMFLRVKNNKPAFLWGVFCFLGVMWGTGVYIVATTKDIHQAFIGWQIANIATIFAPVVHHHFVCAFLKLQKQIQLILLYSIAAILAFLNFFYKDAYLGDLKFMFNEFYYIYWPAQKNFSYIVMYLGFYWALLLYSFSLLLKRFSISKGIEREKIKFFIFGSSIAWVGAHGDFLAAFGFNIYPHANIFLATFPLIVGYAIIKHQFMDINIVIKRSIIYSILITVISIIFLVSVLIIEKLFQDFLGYHTMASSILAAVLIAFAFTPIKDKIQNFVDKYFFKATPIELVEQNALLRSEVADKEKFKAVATLASSIAHEIKNPLATIKTFFEYLPDKKNDPEFIGKLNKIVGTEINHVDQLVHQLLEFAKPSPAIFAKTNVHQLISDALDFIAPHLNKNNIALIKNFPAESDLFIEADSNKLKQALLNIFFNAIDAMPNGGQLKISSTVSRGSLAITIEDTGCGIDPKDLPHIFEPFYSKKDKGTGLGLAITQNIIEEHKGSIKVESKYGAGTKFTLKLQLY